MTMYRIQSGEKRLQPFRSTAFGQHYLERDLEAWLEDNPEVMTDGEPLLIIGRQLTTSLGGTLDLLGLDADGATVVVELKRAPTPRDIIAQALEYATWVASLDQETVKQYAQEHLTRRGGGISLERAWQLTFGEGAQAEGEPGLGLTEHRLNERQRILVVAEGVSERLAAVARYLRSQGVDITLLEYSYYETVSDEQILDIEQRVGREEIPGPTGPRPRYTEERLMAAWGEKGTEVYSAFRNHLMQDEQLVVSPQKSAISFYKQTRDGRAFICYFSFTPQRGLVGFRLDSLQERLDVHGAIAAIQGAAPDLQMNLGTTWCAIHFPPLPARGLEVARLVTEHIASKVE